MMVLQRLNASSSQAAELGVSGVQNQLKLFVCSWCSEGIYEFFFGSKNDYLLLGTKIILYLHQRTIK
jgi:hypothetical protein